VFDVYWWVKSNDYASHGTEYRGIKRRHRLMARLPVPRDLDSFDFEKSALSKTQFRHAYAGDYLTTARNAVFPGGKAPAKHLWRPRLDMAFGNHDAPVPMNAAPPHSQAHWGLGVRFRRFAAPERQRI
jgi:hypothetical protein